MRLQGAGGSCLPVLPAAWQSRASPVGGRLLPHGATCWPVQPHCRLGHTGTHQRLSLWHESWVALPHHIKMEADAGFLIRNSQRRCRGSFDCACPSNRLASLHEGRHTRISVGYMTIPRFIKRMRALGACMPQLRLPLLQGLWQTGGPLCGGAAWCCWPRRGGSNALLDNICRGAPA